MPGLWFLTLMLTQWGLKFLTLTGLTSLMKKGKNCMALLNCCGQPALVLLIGQYALAWMLTDCDLLALMQNCLTSEFHCW